MMPSYIVWGNLCFGYFKNCFEWRKSPVYTTLSRALIKKINQNKHKIKIDVVQRENSGATNKKKTVHEILF